MAGHRALPAGAGGPRAPRRLLPRRRAKISEISAQRTAPARKRQPSRGRRTRADTSDAPRPNTRKAAAAAAADGFRRSVRLCQPPPPHTHTHHHHPHPRSLAGTRPADQQQARCDGRPLLPWVGRANHGRPRPSRDGPRFGTRPADGFRRSVRPSDPCNPPTLGPAGPPTARPTRGAERSSP